MTPSDIIDRVKELKPSVLKSSALLKFINDVEAKIIEKIHNNPQEFIPYKFENIETDKLLLTYANADVYIYYVSSQVALFSNDIDSYNNFTLLYNNAIDTYADQYISRNKSNISYKYNTDRLWNS